MGFTCNSEARWESCPLFKEVCTFANECPPYGAHAQGAIFTSHNFPKHMSPTLFVPSRTYDFTSFNPRPQPPFPFLPLALPPRLHLNVRQVIYTRGFTARMILRKAVTRGRNATRETPALFPERKTIFSLRRISARGL